MESVGSFPAAVGDLSLIWIVLACRGFRAKTLANEGWVSLDSLVRIETYQWVTRGKPRKYFRSRFFPEREALREERG